jgi:hypothetical protein
MTGLTAAEIGRDRTAKIVFIIPADGSTTPPTG